MTKFEQSFWGQKGYEELRKLSRQGSDFCKEIANILNDRSKIEQNYAEQLSKLSSKATKMCPKDILGTLKTSWEEVTKEMEEEAEIHRALSNQIHDEGSKQLKVFVETQIKNRKGVEATVDKAYKTFCDRLNESLKSKKNSYSKAKELDALNEQLDDIRIGKGKATSDKDIQRLEAKVKKLKETSAKTDKEYRELYHKAERTRLEWEAAMTRCCQTCEKLEEERVNYLKDVFSLYSNMLAAVVPQIQQYYDNIQQVAFKIQPTDDVRLIADTKGLPREPAEQVLYDCYEEDIETNMNFDRRREALETKVKMLAADLDQEKKAKQGILNLLETYTDTPEFSSQELQQDVTTQLTHANAMINSLQASLFKLQITLAKLCSHEKPVHQYMNYITTTKDKQGIAQSVLKIPLDQITTPGYDSDGQLDEFDDDFTSEPVLCQCRVLYAFAGEQSDQLTINPGDIISVTEKMNDGWWKGEVNNMKGFFPESYVEII